MTGPQTLALRLLNDASGMLDTHQLRWKMTIASGGKHEWSYDRAHALLVRMERAGWVSRFRTHDGSASRWDITERGLRMLELTIT